MEDNKSPQEDSKYNQPEDGLESNQGEGRGRKRIRTILSIFVVLVVIGAGGYFLKESGLINSKNIFTNYKPLLKDTLAIQAQSDSLSKSNTEIMNDYILSKSMDSKSKNYYVYNRMVDASDIQDSIVENQAKKKDSLWLNTLDSVSNKKALSIDFLEVNTDYSHALGTASSGDIAESKKDSDMFSQLIMPTKTERELGKRLLGNDQINYTTILKMLSVVSCDMLVHGENMYNQQLLQIITENEFICDVFIVNREGIIVHSTHRTRINKPMTVLLKSFDVNSRIMKNIETEERNYLAIPLYYTYGMIGQAVLAIEKESR